MNVFFDLECANCNKHIAKICEFGYVITDDELNIIERDELLIDPRAGFNTYGFQKAGLKLAYTTAQYRKAPPLKDRYEFIKSLLTDGNNRVFGYSTEYDAEYINSDFRRSGLEPINFKFVDVMKLFREYLGRKEKLSLDVVYSECENVPEVYHHQAENDAFMTVECLKLFLRTSGMTLEDVINGCPLAHGELFNGRVVVDGTIFRYTKGNRMSNTNDGIVKSLAENTPVKKRRDGVDGLTFCFDRKYYKEHFAQVLLATDKVVSCGGKMTNITSKANYLVVERKGDKIAHSRRQKVVWLGHFAAIIGLDLRRFDENNIDVDALIGTMPENAAWYESYLNAHK